MTTSPEIHELATALSKAQGEMAGAAKSAANPFFKSKYADLESVRDAVQGPLSKHGLSYLQSPTTEGAKVSVEMLLMHTSGQWIRDTLSCVAKDDGPQAIGSCITYLRRYSLQSFTGIAPTDDDAEAAEGRGNGKTHRPVLVPQVPTGYAEWLTGFTTAADGGLDSMRAFWRESAQTMRDHLMQTSPKLVDSLKERATFVDSTKTPVTPELAHEEAVAKMRPKASRA
jgi:hypothetical protein